MAKILEGIVEGKEEAIVERLLQGLPVALPTETVYGLGARADDDHAVNLLYNIKKRPRHNPLILHCADTEMAWRYVEKTDISTRIGTHFWPGPLTMVLPKRQDKIPYLARAMTEDFATLAVRIPGHSLTRSIIHKVGCPIAMPSANLSCRLSPTRSLHVKEAFSHHDLWIVEGGDTRIGLESSVISFADNHSIHILRPGSITASDLQAILPKEVRITLSSHPTHTPKKNHPQKLCAPGQMAVHYAPKKPLRKDVRTPERNEAYLGFGKIIGATLNLSPEGSLTEAAQRLYHYLHLLDLSDAHPKIGVAPIPYHGLGIAINDRLQRAAQAQR